MRLACSWACIAGISANARLVGLISNWNRSLKAGVRSTGGRRISR
jgi:hypothetical protein